jgi:hypothetical protein
MKYAEKMSGVFVQLIIYYLLIIKIKSLQFLKFQQKLILMQNFILYFFSSWFKKGERKSLDSNG